MKTSYKIFIVAMIWLCMTACLSEDDLFNTTEQKAYLVVSLGIDIAVKDASNRISAVNPEDFIIKIFNSDGSVYQVYNRFGNMPDTITVDPGTYYVEASSGLLLPGGFESPYFSGRSADVVLNAEESKSVPILCTLGNCKITVFYSQQITGGFTDYFTRISSPDTSITIMKGDSRPVYFDLKPLTITAFLFYLKTDGSTGQKQVSGSIPAPQKQKHYEVHFDAGLSDPAALLDVTVDETEFLELVNFSESGGSIPDGGIPYGGLLFTEIMYNPQALSDTDGEWFELYNPTPDSIDLFNLVIKRGAIDDHIIPVHVLIAPGDFIVMARKDTATGVLNEYIYGSSISLPNTGEELSIFNYGTDGTDGLVIATVHYGSAQGFPDGNGASISLDPANFQVDEAKTGANWCVSSIPYSTGDRGSPGGSNEPCY